MKPAEIRALSSSGILKRLEEAYQELFNLRFQSATRQLVKTSEIRQVRKRVARLRTILGEKELA